MTKIEKDSNRGGPDGADHYSPPWENGFQVCFSTEAKVPTWDPMLQPEEGVQGRVKNRKAGEPYGTAYWTGPDMRVTDNLEGDDSRVIMDRVIPFVRNAVKNDKPFFAVIWFHTPHAPVVAGSEYRGRYDHLSPGEQHYYGCLTAMDEQVGRLRELLRQLGVEQNSMLWFCSDNGPEGKRAENRNQGTTNGLRGRKRSLYEGGIRVPGLLVWPDKIHSSKSVSTPCCTSDYLPTILDILDAEADPQSEPIDGVSLLPLIEGAIKERACPIGFESGKQIAWIDDRYKIISSDKGETYALYDLIRDPAESTDLAEKHPEVHSAMKKAVEAWRKTRF